MKTIVTLQNVEGAHVQGERLCFKTPQERLLNPLALGNLSSLQVKTDFCQKMLPLFIHDTLLGDRNGSWRELLSTHIQHFFSSCCRPAISGSQPTTPMPSDSGTAFCFYPFTTSEHCQHVARCISSHKVLIIIYDKISRLMKTGSFFFFKSADFLYVHWSSFSPGYGYSDSTLKLFLNRRLGYWSPEPTR